jgi:glucokinase
VKIVTADIGGTNARFAFAELPPGGQPIIGPVSRFRVDDFAGLKEAWQAFAAQVQEPLPSAVAVGVAAPIDGDVLRFVNSHWVIDRRTLHADLGVRQATILNDFGAIAHAVAAMSPDELAPLAGPDGPIPARGITSVIGPGTGLGVALLLRREGLFAVIETEGAHIGFSPQNADEARIADALSAKYGRVSVERIVSGPGLTDIYTALGGSAFAEDAPLWAAALAGTDPLAARALEILIECFGTAAGDLALAHGSNAVVIAGGLSNRMRDRLEGSPFHARFTDKGRYRARMEGLPVRLALHPEPGLLGAAVAFQREHGSPV